MNEILLKRIKSFLWRAFDLGAVAIVSYVASNLGYFNIPTVYVGIIGLALGEVTKYLNNQAQQPLP